MLGQMAEIAGARSVMPGISMHWLQGMDGTTMPDGMPPRLLSAGPVSVALEAGQLRHLRYRGIEIVRSLGFVVRDGEGEKIAPRIHEWQVREAHGRFEITAEARVLLHGHSLCYVLHIAACARRLRLTVKASARTGFSAGLAGLEILLPRSGMAGRQVQVEDIGGDCQHTWMPEPQALLQPLSMLHALAYEPQPGLQIGCRVLGGHFELAGQRHGAGGLFRIQARALAQTGCRLPEHGQLLQMASFTFDDAPVPAACPAR